MKKFTISTERFLDWYFDYGQDSENQQIREDLAEGVLQQLRETGTATITVESLFSRSNHDAVRYCFTEECEDPADDTELQDLGGEFTLELI